MKILSKFYILFVLIMIVSMISACAQATPTVQNPPEQQETEAVNEAPEATTAPEPTKEEAAEPITIRFMTAEVDPPSVEAYEEIIAVYEAEHPNVTISLELINSDDLNTKLAAALAVGEPPHIAQCDQYIVPEYVAADYLVNIDDKIAEVGLDKFYPGSVMNIEGQYYNVPYAGSGTVWWVRKDLFEAAGVAYPTNAEELVAAAKALTVDENNDGQPETYGIVFPAGSNQYTAHMFMEFLHQQGQSLFSADLVPNMNTQKAQDALALMSELANYAPSGIAAYSYFDVIDAFASGKVAMAPYMGRVLAQVAANNPDLLPKIDAIPFVAGNSGNKTNFGGWDSYCIYKGPENIDVAKDFAIFLTTGDIAAKFLITVPGHLIPPMLDMVESPLLWEEPLFRDYEPIIRTVYEGAETSLNIGNEAGAIAEDGTLTDTRVFNLYAATILSRQTLPTVVQMVLLDGKTPAEAVEWGQAELETILAEAGSE